MSTQGFEFFRIEVDRHVALVTFDRPPVNAFSYAVYEEMLRLVEHIEAYEDTRVVVFTAPAGARAWIGGADLKDFLDLTYESRLKRYELVNRATDRFFHLSRPVIAAINSHAIGAGMTFASQCDIRVASEAAFFSMPEVDRGLTSGGGAPFFRLNMPVGKIREIILTGRRFLAHELQDTGFFNYILPPADVLPKAMEIAAIIAGKSLPALQATKLCANAIENLSFAEGRALSQEYSARLTSGLDAKEGIRAFLEKRAPGYARRDE